MDKDNIISAIPRVSVENPTSQKTGNKYNRIVIHFHDGYQLNLLLSSEQVQCIKYALAAAPKSDNMLSEQD